MANVNSAVGMIFEIKANTGNAESEIKKLSGVVASESDKAGSAGATGFGKLATSLGLSSSQAESLAGAMPAIGSAIASVVGTATGLGVTLFKLAQEASDFGSEINDASEKSGLGAKSLSALKYAADLSGSSFEEVTKGVQKFTLLVADAAKGGDGAAESLKRLGISSPKAAVDDLDGSLAQVIKRIYESKNSVEQNSLAAEAFGKKLGTSLIPTINSTKGDLSEFTKEAEKLGVTISDADAKLSDEFGDTLDTVKAQIGGVTREFAYGFMPAFTAGMSEVSGWLARNKDEMRKWGERVGDVLTGTIDYWNKAKESADGYFDSIVRGLGADPNGETVNNLEETGKYIAFGLPYIFADKAEDRGSEIRKKREEENLLDLDDSKVFRPPSVGDSDAFKSIDKAEKKAKEAIPTFRALLDAMRGASMGQESGGRQGAVNARTKASGLFQVMPENIPEWTKNTPGVGPMSVEEFKKDASAQIKVYNNYMGKYLREGLAKSGGDWKKAIRMAAVRWYGGKAEQYDQDWSPNPGKEPTRAQYTKSIQSRTLKNLKLKSLTGDDFDEFEQQKQVNAQIVADREKTDSRILELDKAAGEERKALLAQILAQKLISEKDYADEVAQIGIDQLEKEKEVLTQRLQLTELTGEQRKTLEQQIALINSEISTKSIEKSTEAIKNQTAELERQRQIAEEIAQLRERVLRSEEDLYDFTQEQQRKILQNDVDFSFGRKRLDALVILNDFDRREIDRKHERENKHLEAEQKKEIENLNKRAETDLALKAHVEEEKKKIEDYYTNLKAQNDAKAAADKQETDKQFRPEIKQAADQSTNSGMFGSGLAGAMGQSILFDGLDDAGNALLNFGNAWQQVGSMAGAAIGQMASGVGSMVQNLVLLGNTGGQSFRKLVASVLAGVSAQAATLAVMETAYGLAALTPWGAAIFGSPTLHFQAAALFASIAVGAGVIGRMTAGSSFQSKPSAGAFAGATDTNSASSAASGGSLADDKTREIIESRRQSAEADRQTTRDLIKALGNIKIENNTTTRATLTVDGNHLADAVLRQTEQFAHPLGDYLKKVAD